MQNLVEQYRNEHDVPAVDIAAALAKMSIGDKPLLLEPEKARPPRSFNEDRPSRDKKRRDTNRRDRVSPEPDVDKQRYRIEVGDEHGVKPGNIVGAIANEAGLAGEHIGHISIKGDFSLVDLPKGMPRDILMDLKKVRVCGRPLKISIDGKPDNAPRKKLKIKSDKPRGKAKPDKNPVGKGPIKRKRKNKP